MSMAISIKPFLMCIIRYGTNTYMYTFHLIKYAELIFKNLKSSLYTNNSHIFIKLFFKLVSELEQNDESRKKYS